MNKIPTIFERDWTGDRSRVLNEPVPGCEWVFAGEGTATQKLDGTCCMILDRLHKRHEVRPGKPTPPNFQLISSDEVTDKQIGWVPVGDGPEDKWHRQAFENLLTEMGGLPPIDGTYELIGPKIQGNPEGVETHLLIAHAQAPVLDGVPRHYAGLRHYLHEHADIEGIVFHHPDGRMAKIKGRDFGVKRVKKEAVTA